MLKLTFRILARTAIATGLVIAGASVFVATSSESALALCKYGASHCIDKNPAPAFPTTGGAKIADSGWVDPDCKYYPGLWGMGRLTWDQALEPIPSLNEMQQLPWMQPFQMGQSRSPTWLDTAQYQPIPTWKWGDPVPYANEMQQLPWMQPVQPSDQTSAGGLASLVLNCPTNSSCSKTIFANSWTGN